MSATGRWIDLGPAANLTRGRLLPLEIDGRAIVVIADRERIYAYEDRCPHNGYPISTGILDGDEIVCGWHGACFALDSGAVRCPPAREGLRAVPVRVTAGRVQVCIA